MILEKRLQMIVNEFFFKLGNNRVLVSVEKTADTKIIAGARGMKLLNNPIGKIYVNGANVDARKLSDDELRFVLAHEVVHIDQNHLPIAILFELPEELLDAWGKNHPVASAASRLWDLINLWRYKQGNLPPKAVITKQQELQADVWAVFLSNNKTSAITCLKKLVNGDLSQFSHTWEALDIELPIMTMCERIDALSQTISFYESQGYRFA